MNEGEAKRELKRFQHRKFRLYFGLISGAMLALIFLGLSFIRPHINFILNMWFYPSIVYGAYCFYMISKLRKIDEVLQNAERSEIK